MEFLELESVMEDNKRFYLTPTGEKYPSVTTVLGSASDKRWLYEWRKKVGEDRANKISNHAATRGTRLHTMCEKYMLNDESFAEKQMPLTIEMFKSIQKYIDMVEIVYGNEIPLYSHELRTAGRTDLFCQVGGKNVILDFKEQRVLQCRMNDTQVPKEWDRVVSYYYQFYASTIERLFKENGHELKLEGQT